MTTDLARRAATVIELCPSGRLGDLFALAFFDPFEPEASALERVRALPDEDLVRSLEEALRRLR